MNVQYTAHCINTILELYNVPTRYGIEVDLRDGNVVNEVIVSHDPWTSGECFDKFMKHYKHAFIILNIKSERIEFNVLKIIKKYKVTNYFFLDCSFPMVHALNNIGETNIALRFSEFEELDTILKMKGNIKWVWVDCFTKQPLTKYIYELLQKNELKICMVSPELQNQIKKISIYKKYLKNENISPDMICTKIENIKKWTSNVHIVIPMSGIGQRFINAGYTIPKPLIEIDGKHLIKYVVELFPNETNVSFICNEIHTKNTNIIELLQETVNGCNIYTMNINAKVKGPVPAVQSIFESLELHDEEVIVSYCDYGAEWNYDDFLKDTRERNADGAVVCYRGFHPHMLGTDNYAFLKEKDENSRWMSDIQEKKPFTQHRMNEYASNGTYYFKSGVILKKYFNLLIELGETVNDEYYVSMVYKLMVNDGLNVSIYEIEKMLQFGTPRDVEIYEGWARYFRSVHNHYPHYIDKLETTIVIPMAGHGSRFSIEGYNEPKPMLPINNIPMFIEATKCLPPTQNIVFVCLEEHSNKYNYKNVIKKYYPHASVIEIDSVTDGQATTCKMGTMNVDINKPVFFSACDNGILYDIEKYQKMINDSSIDVIVFSFKNNQCSVKNTQDYAWMRTDENNNVLDVSCKKLYDDCNPLTTHCVTGAMFFRKTKYFLDGYKTMKQKQIKTKGEYYLDNVIQQNIESGLNVKVFEVQYACWGTPTDYKTFLYWQEHFNNKIRTKSI